MIIHKSIPFGFKTFLRIVSWAPIKALKENVPKCPEKISADLR
jgi:hypothetical protein